MLEPGSGSDNSWMENNPLLPGNNPGSGADSGTGEDTGNSEENDTADLSKDSSQWVDRDKSGIYDGSINSMIVLMRKKQTNRNRIPE